MSWLWSFLLLCGLVCCANGQSCSIGRSLAEQDSPIRANNFYLDTQHPALCSGSITQVEYCYYAPNFIGVAFDFTFAVYRESSPGEYSPVTDSFTVRRGAGNVGDVFNCLDFMFPQEIELMAGDLFGACVHEPSLLVHELDIIANSSNSDDFLMSRDTTGCTDSEVPASVSSSSLTMVNFLVMHIHTSIDTPPTTEPPATEQPTTEAATTEAPATEAPTTDNEQPTTESEVVPSIVSLASQITTMGPSSQAISMLQTTSVLPSTSSLSTTIVPSTTSASTMTLPSTTAMTTSISQSSSTPVTTTSVDFQTTVIPSSTVAASPVQSIATQSDSSSSSVLLSTAQPTSVDQTTIDSVVVSTTDLQSTIVIAATPIAIIDGGTTMMETDSPTTEEELATPPSLVGNNTLIIAVVVPLVAVVVVAMVTVVLVGLYWRRRRKGRLVDFNPGIDNVIYNNTSSEYRLYPHNGALVINNDAYDDVVPCNGMKNPNFDHNFVDSGAYDSVKQYESYEMPKVTSNEYAEVGSYQVASGEYDCPIAAAEKLDLVENNDSVYDYASPYQMPATREVELYGQLKSWGTRSIPRADIKVTGHLGSGQFGSVEQGVWKRGGANPVDIALKSLTSTQQEDKVKFLQEAAIMAQFKHPNVIALHGVVIRGEPVLIVAELAARGDLRSFLHTVQPRKETAKHLLRFSQQVALGMVYLSEKGFVHRDLAARNILVTDESNCKIADFGMSRDLADETYYVSQGGKVPVKWTAPEALHYKKYSTASDVWSYGCLLYEIWSLGHKPFEGRLNTDVIKIVDSGKRLPPPAGCPRTIYELMIKCWHPETVVRPGFNDIVATLVSTGDGVLAVPEGVGSQLGGALDAGVDLYRDLQTKYTKYYQQADQDTSNDYAAAQF